MTRVTRYKETFREVLNRGDIGDLVFVVTLAVESVLDVLLLLWGFDENFTFGSGSGQLLLIEPDVIGVVVILADFLELGEGLESTLLDAPHLPVRVA